MLLIAFTLFISPHASGNWSLLQFFQPYNSGLKIVFGIYLVLFFGCVWITQYREILFTCNVKNYVLKQKQSVFKQI